MASIEQSAKGKKDGDIRYLTPLNIETNKTKKYCRFKKSGIKYIDYKDADFLLKFVNEQGKILPRRLTGTSLKYETVFILNPVLSETQVKETVQKFEEFLTSRGAEMVAKEDWGLKKLAYEIQHKKSGFYHLFEYKVAGDVIINLETEFRRDERVMRFLTVALDKHAISWAERRREKLKSKKA